MYDSQGAQLGRIGWEPTKVFLEHCGFFNYKTPRIKTNAVRTWTLYKTETTFDLYCEDVHLVSINVDGTSCASKYKGNVVSAVSYEYFAVLDATWQEKPISEKNKFFGIDT